MQIVNTKGEVAFLSKPKYMEIQDLIYSHIINIVPDFQNRCTKYVKDNSNKKLKFGKVLAYNEISEIIKNIYKDFDILGIIHTKYIKSNTTYEDSTQNNNTKIIDITSDITNQFNNYLNEDNDIYQINGEDMGDEYDDR